MHIINLRKHYPHYTEDVFIEVSDEVYEVILLSIRQKNNYDSRMYYHKAHYSLDCNDGILRVRYLHEHRREMYRELLVTGKLAEHCKAIDKTALERSERIQEDWLGVHPMPLEDTQELSDCVHRHR